MSFCYAGHKYFLIIIAIYSDISLAFWRSVFDFLEAFWIEVHLNFNGYSSLSWETQNVASTLELDNCMLLILAVCPLKIIFLVIMETKTSKKLRLIKWKKCKQKKVKWKYLPYDIWNNIFMKHMKYEGPMGVHGMFENLDDPFLGTTAFSWNMTGSLDMSGTIEGHKGRHAIDMRADTGSMVSLVGNRWWASSDCTSKT